MNRRGFLGLVLGGAAAVAVGTVKLGRRIIGYRRVEASLTPPHVDPDAPDKLRMCWSLKLTDPIYEEGQPR